MLAVSDWFRRTTSFLQASTVVYKDVRTPTLVWSQLAAGSIAQGGFGATAPEDMSFLEEGVV